jgi:magnesium-transporting ATPase (P-type)
MVVTETGMSTQMGRIATMLSTVTRTRSPLQRELGTLTKVLGIIAWGAVAFIVIVGVARGEKFSDVLLLGTAMAISAIPTGMPAFVSGLLSFGAKQLAEAKAVVKNLTDVETLGATSAINTDKTGTLTLNQMMVSTLYNGSWFTVEGEGYRKSDVNLGDLADIFTYVGFWRFLLRYPKMCLDELHRSFSKRLFCQSLQKLVPEIREDDLATGGAGVRAQALDPNGSTVQDFRFASGPNILHVLNAPSPGATASLAIGQEIVGRVASAE